MKKLLACLIVVLMAVSAVSAVATADNPEKIKVLILPKFENGEMAGDFPGEAQFYYEGYVEGGRRV